MEFVEHLALSLDAASLIGIEEEEEEEETPITEDYAFAERPFAAVLACVPHPSFDVPCGDALLPRGRPHLASEDSTTLPPLLLPLKDATVERPDCRHGGFKRSRLLDALDLEDSNSVKRSCTVGWSGCSLARGVEWSRGLWRVQQVPLGICTHPRRRLSVHNSLPF